MSNKKYYDPSDKSSSPYEPMIGSVVIFQPIRNGVIGRQLWPAIITNICDTPDDRVDLTVFSNQGVIHVSRIPFSSDPLSQQTWNWMDEPKRREIKNSPTKDGETVEKQEPAFLPVSAPVP